LINTASRFLKNIGFNIIADFSTKLANAVLILMLSNFLGISAMGTYSIAHNFFSLGLIFSYWGLGNLLIREVSKDKDTVNQYLSNFVVIRIVFAIITILIINVVAQNLNYSEQTLQTIQIISLGILASTILNLLFAFFIAFEELKYLSIISLIISLLRLLISFMVLNLGGSIITVAILYTVLEYLSIVLGIVSFLRFSHKFKFNFDIQFSLKQLGRAFPLFLVSLLVIMDSRMEILIISAFLNEIEVGFFTAMNTIIGGISLFAEGLRNAIFPIFGRYQKESPKDLHRLNLVLGKYIALITFPITISCFFFSETIVSLLFGEQYDISVLLLRIVIWTFIGYSYTVVAIRLLMVHDQENHVVLALFISGALTIILNILLVPSTGVIGVAVVRLFTTYVLTFLCLFFTVKMGYKPIDFSDLVKIMIVSIIYSFAIFLLKPINVFLTLIVSNILYLLLIWFLRIITKNEIHLWKGIFRGLFEFSPNKEQ
jgi:O-antigen/teichoic acid export membrane protein